MTSTTMESPTDILNDQGVFGNGIYKSDNDLQVDAGESSSSPSSPPPKTVRVSFREGTKPPTTCTGSHRSLTDFSMSDDTSYSSGSNLQHYSRLRSNLTRSQINRNPLYFYQVTKTLGEGSMGDVKLVVKRRDKIGGSARRDIQQAVRRQKMHQKCLRLPLVGGIFRFCIDGDLPDNVDSNSHHSRRTPNTSTHSVLSLFSQNTAESAAGRSFEDSLLGGDDEENKDDSNNVYAMKSILIDQVARQEFVDELRNEIAILKDLDHPNIVRAIETFEWKGAISIVMEVCSGGDLYSRDPYSEEEANRIIRSVLSAISYMHSRNVAHRDLKYENILFVSKYTSEVKLIDFGLSRVYQDTAHLTDIAGTIYTMAPEVLQGFHTEKADLWSIGVLAYMLLVSSLPFYGRDRDSIIKKIFRNKPSFREKRWNDVSKEAKLFINRLLVSDPDRRIDAETALKSPWITMYTEHASASSTDDVTSEQRALVREAILRYAEYPKLKKMALMVVAHKSNSDEIGMLKKVFKQYDTRHDGSIWFGDFCANMQPSKLSGDELRDVFDAMDLSGSGRVRYTEFIAATIEVHGTISEARLAEAFDRLDCDDSGFITVSNLMELIGKEASKEDVEDIIQEVDKDRDGSVSYSEYLGMWEDSHGVDQKTTANNKVLQSELSSMTIDSGSDGSDLSPSEAFLQQKHLQNTLHTWAMEMQLPPHEFAMGCSFLHQVALGQLSNVEDILETRPGLVNFRDYDRRTALHIAASEGYLDICELLVRKGARINRADRWGGFPLDDAHRHRHTDVMTYLHTEGAKFGSTPQKINLITAASQGNVKEVQELLAFGSIDLNQGDYDKRTALHLAAHGGHVEVVQMLCDAGADVNVKDRWGDKPLDDAKKAKMNVQEMVSILTGSTTPGQDHSIRMATMEALMEHASNSGSKLKDIKDEDDTLQMSIPEFAMGCSLLHQAAVGNLLVCRKIVLEQPKLANFQDYDRRTPLMIAAAEGQLKICKFLVSKGARINRVDRWGHAPLDDAYQFGHKGVVQFLREQGAKFGSTSQITNFITAASEGDVDEVEAFLQHGSMDINQGDYDGRTALHLAAGEGHIEIVKRLCEAGADANVQDRWGHCPLDDATNAPTNGIGITKVLVRHGGKSKKPLTALKSTLLSLLPS